MDPLWLVGLIAFKAPMLSVVGSILTEKNCSEPCCLFHLRPSPWTISLTILHVHQYPLLRVLLIVTSCKRRRGEDDLWSVCSLISHAVGGQGPGCHLASVVKNSQVSHLRIIWQLQTHICSYLQICLINVFGKECTYVQTKRIHDFARR